MIVCVHEYPDDKDYGRIVFIDTGLAMTSMQRTYVKKIEEAIKTRDEVKVPRECSLWDEEGDEIDRMVVQLPQRVEACVKLLVDGV